jgi:hypothetical protein
MGWNHRVLAFTYEDEVRLQIHEVYYNKKGKPDAYTVNPVSVNGESLKNIKWTLKQMKECLNKPILSGDNFPKIYKFK